ncbi:unnamed protein product, partial [marine sediment metagenome]
LAGKSLRNAINELLPKEQGFIWWINPVDPMDPDSEVEIFVQTTLDEELVVNGFTMPANDDQVVIDLWTDQTFVSPEVRQTGSLLYDRIVIIGAKMKTCFTLDILDSYFELGWTATTEQRYLDAASGTTGYSGLTYDEKAIKNDIYRGGDQFKTVFNTFHLASDWDWKVWDHQASPEVLVEVNPALDDLGVLDLNATGEYLNDDKKFFGWTPFLEGWDYSGATPVNNNPANNEPEERPIYAFLTPPDQSPGIYGYA